jgi:hypothetical protein
LCSNTWPGESVSECSTQSKMPKRTRWILAIRPMDEFHERAWQWLRALPGLAKAA